MLFAPTLVALAAALPQIVAASPEACGALHQRDFAIAAVPVASPDVLVKREQDAALPTPSIVEWDAVKRATSSVEGLVTQIGDGQPQAPTSAPGGGAGSGSGGGHGGGSGGSHGGAGASGSPGGAGHSGSGPHGPAPTGGAGVPSHPSGAGPSYGEGPSGGGAAHTSKYVPTYTGSHGHPSAPAVANAAVGGLQPFFVLPNILRRQTSRKNYAQLLRGRSASPAQAELLF